MEFFNRAALQSYVTESEKEGLLLVKQTLQKY